MKIVADSKIPFVKEAFADVADVEVLDTQAITGQTIRTADVLLVRSETRVDRELVSGSHIRFVGTATIGTDHVDTEYLHQLGIGFANASGSNANSVAEYIVAALLVLSERFGLALEGKALGIVGVGNVGSIVARYAQSLGLAVVLNDPPRARAGEKERFRSIDELMECDIITLHVPLSKSGDDRTYHLFDERRIGMMKRGSILINTSRGAVVETGAIKNALSSHHLLGSVLDVWEKEPAIDIELLSKVTLGTPHIAGYSYDGKVNGAAMIHKAVCEYFGLASAWNVQDVLNQRPVPPAVMSAEPMTGSGLLAIIQRCYDIEGDDSRLRGVLPLADAEQGAYFRRLRSEYPVRREFGFHEVVLDASQSSLVGVLKAIGFRKIALKT